MNADMKERNVKSDNPTLKKPYQAIPFKKAKKDSKSYTIRMNSSDIEHLESLKEKLGHVSITDIFKHSIQLLDYIAERHSEGASIGIKHKDSNIYDEIQVFETDSSD